MKYLKRYESKAGITFEEWIAKNPLKSDAKTLYCYNNNITDLNGIEKYTNLTSIEIFVNDISDFSPVEGMVNLTKILCSYNKIKKVDLSKLINLKTLNISGNLLETIEIPVNLEVLNCGGNLLTTLNFPRMSKLTRLNCNDNQLEELDLMNIIALKELHCDNNKDLAIIDNAEKCLGWFSCKGTSLPYNDLEGYWEWYYKQHQDRAEAEKFNM